MNSIAILLSGSGRTLENIIRSLPETTVSVVIASREDAYGVVIAKDHGIPAYVVPRRAYADTASFSVSINTILAKHPADLIVLAGFMHLYDFPPEYEGRVMNIHPALIPSFCGKGFYGMKVHEAVCEKGVKITGCTVHFVDNKYDNGPIILQSSCPVTAEDTPADVASRVFALECEAYPRAIRLFFDGRLSVSGGKVRIKDE